MISDLSPTTQNRIVHNNGVAQIERAKGRFELREKPRDA